MLVVGVRRSTHLFVTVRRTGPQTTEVSREADVLFGDGTGLNKQKGGITVLVVRVEVHSARTRKVKTIAVAKICNVGGTERLGNYEGTTFKLPYKGNIYETLAKSQQLRHGRVALYARKSSHVWNLIARMLNQMGYK